MPFVPTETVIETVRQILEERFDRHTKSLGGSFLALPAVRKWVIDEFDFPEGGDRGDYPKGIVLLDGERTSERREQDTGETARIPLTVRLAFSTTNLSKADAERLAMRYGDGIYYTLMREALVKRPKDGTVLPGLFRIWPDGMRCGAFAQQDLAGCEVRSTVIVDSSFSAAI